MTNLDIFVMELRPQLQSCNVYIKFKSKIATNTKIYLKINEIIIRSYDFMEKIPVLNYKILPSSLSCLQITTNSVSFRFLTENLTKSTGQFKREVVLFEPEDQCNNSIDNKNLVKKGYSYIMKCKNCSKDLSKTLEFERVLPLPSESAEPSEWFCHKHDETDLNLEPKLKDCFYSKCYFHINQNNLNNIRNANNNILVCNNCLAWLGLVVKSQTVKLWHNTINLTTNNNININSTPLSDFIVTVKNCIAESVLGFSKFIFECPNLNSNIEYLSIWVLEKKLKLFVKGTNDNFDEIDVAKVLFRFDSEITDLLTIWMNDVKVNQVTISKPMMVAGLNHLYEMFRLIPSCYSKSNQYFVSYLNL